MRYIGRADERLSEAIAIFDRKGFPASEASLKFYCNRDP